MAEAWRNITATGAKPLAVTDNLNFGNPEKPEIMGQFVFALRGMAAACRALDFPIVSGNVSLYNETQGAGILPTPAIGGLGVIENAADAVGIGLSPGQDLVLIGAATGHLGQSLWLREIAGLETGAPPPVDLAARTPHWRFRPPRAILDKGIQACHDVSDGGLLVAVAEMAMASGLGAHLIADAGTLSPHAFWFGEEQGRYVAATQECGRPAGRSRRRRCAGRGGWARQIPLV